MDFSHLDLKSFTTGNWQSTTKQFHYWYEINLQMLHSINATILFLIPLSYFHIENAYAYYYNICQ